MASRPIFIPRFEGDVLVETVSVEFQWFPGMAVSQKQKSVDSLQQAAIESQLCNRPLEVSSKSREDLGVQLSAFNLSAVTKKKGKRFTVESAYQSSKVFERDGPYVDLLYEPSRVAKKDERIRNSGRLLRFEFFGQSWELEPKTAFYDWLYLKSLLENPSLVDSLAGYDAFTDIEFNPSKSFNCQAYSVALFKSLDGRGLLRDVLGTQKTFIDAVSSFAVSNTSENTKQQPRLV